MASIGREIQYECSDPYVVGHKQLRGLRLYSVRVPGSGVVLLMDKILHYPL